MKTIDKDSEFLDFFYKYYSSLRIFTVAAIAAAVNDDYRKQDAEYRIDSAKKREAHAEARYVASEKKSKQASDPAPSMSANQSKPADLKALQEDAITAIQTLVKYRGNLWHLSVQEILNSDAGVSVEEKALLQEQFPELETMTVDGLLNKIKLNLIAMLNRTMVGSRDREFDVAMSFKRWLQWNKSDIQYEIAFFLQIEQHMGSPDSSKSEFNQIMVNVDRVLGAANIGYADARQAMETLERIWLSHNAVNIQRNKLIAQAAIDRLRSLMANVVRIETFSWFRESEEGKKINTWMTLIDSKKEEIYGCDLTDLNESWENLQTALKDDLLLKQNTKGILDEKNARRLALEAITKFGKLKKWFGLQKDKLDENVIVRFFKNIGYAFMHPWESCKALGKWCRENPWKTGFFLLGGFALIALTVIAPYSAPFIYSGIAAATISASEITAIAITGSAALSLSAVVIAATHEVGSLVRTQMEIEGDEVSRLEEEARKAEERADAAERKANEAEAKFSRTKADSYASEDDKLKDESNAYIARVEAINEKRRALAAKKAVEQAQARKKEALVPQSTSENSVVRFNLQTQEDSIDSILSALQYQEGVRGVRVIQLETDRSSLLSGIDARRIMAQQSIQLEMTTIISQEDSEHSEITELPIRYSYRRASRRNPDIWANNASIIRETENAPVKKRNNCSVM